MLDPNDYPVYDFAIALALGKIMPANLGPIDLGSMDDLEAMGVIDLYFLMDIWAFNDGCVVPVALLDQVDPLVYVMILIHLHIISTLGY